MGAPVVVLAEPLCNQHAPATAALTRLQGVMAHGRFVAYQPTSLQVIDGRPTQANPGSIRADLTVLRQRFDALITYGAAHGAEAIPAIAASLHYRALIIGVWNPFDAAELSAAITAANQFPKLVVGLSLGNETIFNKLHSFAELAEVMAKIRARMPKLALSTTEPFHMFYQSESAPLFEQMDFLLANVHPVFQSWFRGASDDVAAQFVVNVTTKLATAYCGPILVKETGVPTAPTSEGYTSKRQASFYQALSRAFPVSGTRAFAYFSAFDAPWRLADSKNQAAAEAHWGLYDEHRQPKPVIKTLEKLSAVQ